MLALRERAGVEVHGNVPDVRPYLQEASVLAVPLEAGGGTRLKILEAFAAGLPVISTAVGCEGLEVSDGVHLLVTDRAAMAERIIPLLDTPALGAHRLECTQIGQDSLPIGASLGAPLWLPSERSFANIGGAKVYRVGR